MAERFLGQTLPQYYSGPLRWGGRGDWPVIFNRSDFQGSNALSSSILFGGVAAWVSRAVSIGLGLVLMPVLFRRLPAADLGLWLLFGQTWSGLSFFDLGFGVVLTRRVAFNYSYRKNRADQGNGPERLADLIATGNRLYGVLAITAFITAFLTGIWFQHRVTRAMHCTSPFWFSWGLLCFAKACGIWTTASSCVIQGTGAVGLDIILGSVIVSLSAVAQAFVLLAGFGVAGLAAVTASGAIAQRLALIWLLRSRTLEASDHRGRWSSDLFRSMLTPAFRAWLTSIGYLLVAASDAIFIAGFRGTEAVPPYRAAFLLVINLHMIAGVFSGATPAFVSQLWQQGDFRQIQRILERNATIGLWTMACGGGAILALGPTLFHWWLGPGNFIGYPILIIFFLAFLLEHHANVFSTCGRATDDEAYGLSSLATGVIKLSLAFFLLPRLGLVGLAASTLFAQVVINNWFMVYRTTVRLRIDFPDHLRRVVVPCVVLLIIALLTGIYILKLLGNYSPALRIVTVSLVDSALLGISLWGLALDRAEQIRVTSWFRCDDSKTLPSHRGEDLH